MERERIYCGSCAKPFVPAQPHSKYCSPECAKQRHRLTNQQHALKHRKGIHVEILGCVHCRKEFIAYNNESFCSEECKSAFYGVYWEPVFIEPIKPREPHFKAVCTCPNCCRIETACRCQKGES